MKDHGFFGKVYPSKSDMPSKISRQPADSGIRQYQGREYHHLLDDKPNQYRVQPLQAIEIPHESLDHPYNTLPLVRTLLTSDVLINLFFSTSS